MTHPNPRYVSAHADYLDTVRRYFCGDHHFGRATGDKHQNRDRVCLISASSYVVNLKKVLRALKVSNRPFDWPQNSLDDRIEDGKSIRCTPRRPSPREYPTFRTRRLYNEPPVQVNQPQPSKVARVDPHFRGIDFRDHADCLHWRPTWRVPLHNTRGRFT